MLFGALEPELQAILRGRYPARVFADGQMIQFRGDEADGFWLIEEGVVRVGQFLADGDFRAVAVLGPGDSYGELALFAARPRVVDAISRGQSRLRFIPGGPFLEALDAHPASNRALLGALSHQIQELLTLVTGLRQGNNPARMAGLIANMAREGSGTNALAITQQELAELMGITRATANATLRELERLGLVRRGYGKLHVPDQQAIARFALA